jgi:hypothetical protein
MASLVVPGRPAIAAGEAPSVRTSLWISFRSKLARWDPGRSRPPRSLAGGCQVAGSSRI